MFSSLFGIKGDDGEQGIQGEQGVQGDKGDKGDKGDTGEAGTIAYTDSGNLVNAHFDMNDFTKNGAWHELDLAGIIAENTQLVRVSGVLYENAGEKIVKFNTNGATSGVNTLNAVTKGTNKYTCFNGWVQPDANRKIQYNIPSSTWQTLDITINGWLL